MREGTAGSAAPLRRAMVRATRVDDAAASEIVGTMMMIATSVLIVGATAFTLLPSDAPAMDRSAVEVSVRATAGESSVYVQHAGGVPLMLEDVRFRVGVDDAFWYDGNATSTLGTWSVGDALRLPLPHPIPPGARVEVTVIHGGHGVIGGANLKLARDLPPATAAGTSFLLTLQNGLEEIRLLPPHTVLLETRVTHPDGRKMIYDVRADLSALGASPWLGLYDDGTRGDRLAGDGIYSSHAYISETAGLDFGVYPYTITARDVNGVVRTSLGDIRISPFDILPSGGVKTFCTAPVTLKIIGVDITMGRNGPRIPVYASFTRDNGTTLDPLFGGGAVSAGMNVSKAVVKGDILGLKGHAIYPSGGFNHYYFSYTSDPHVRVLEHGDAVPDVPAFGNQTGVSAYLAPYVNPITDTIRLDVNQVIYLYEFNPSLTSTAADYQDLVVLMTFPVDGCNL